MTRDFFAGFPPKSEGERRSITTWSLIQLIISSFFISNNFVENFSSETPCQEFRSKNEKLSKIRNKKEVAIQH